MPRGGRRPGSGRKPKSALEKAITGDPGHRGGRVLTHPSGGQVPVVAAIDECDAPNDLAMDARHVWMELAPKAVAAGTMVPQMSKAFSLLCECVVLERELAKDPDKRGGSDHRGMIKEVAVGLLRFNLAPCGKAVIQAVPDAKPANPLEKFLNRNRG